MEKKLNVDWKGIEKAMFGGYPETVRRQLVMSETRFVCSEAIPSTKNVYENLHFLHEKIIV